MGQAGDESIHPTHAQMGQAVERARAYLSTKWAHDAAEQKRVFHRFELYAVKAMTMPREVLQPVPGRPGWWVAGEVLRVGDGRAIYDVWVEPATMRVKVRRVPR